MAFKFEMNTEQIKRTSGVLNELYTKFPLLELEDVYDMFDGITQQTKVTRVHFDAVILLMHWVKNNNVVLDLLEIKKMKIKRSEKTWSYDIRSINGHEVKIKLVSNL